MSANPVIKPDSVVLVTGGGRGITAACVIEAATAYKCQYILLGRTRLDVQEPIWVDPGASEEGLKQNLVSYARQNNLPIKPAEMNQLVHSVLARHEIQDTLDRIRRSGARAEYLSVDISDAAALKKVIETLLQRFNRVTGIIHGAGALADKRIENKTIHDFATVFDPKVNGLFNLLNLLPASQLDFLVLFSSIVSVSGNAGQADYAMANRVLDAAARKLRTENPDSHIMSINWGPWESGMVSPALKAYFEMHGVHLIPMKDGAKEFVRLLDSSQYAHLTQIITGSMPPRVEQLPQSSIQRVRRIITRTNNPFLEDHSIGGNPVLPATCAAAWMAHTAEQVYPGLTAYCMEDFKILKGITFPDDTANEYTTEIHRISSSKKETSVEVIVSGNSRAKLPMIHYSARFRLAREIPLAPQQSPGEYAPRPIFPGPSLYQDGTCFHGPIFQGIQHLYELDQVGLVMEARLKEVTPDQMGQFQVRLANPYFDDAIVQSLLVWTQKLHNVPCLPSYAGQVFHYQPVSFDEAYLVRLAVQSFSDTKVTGNISVWNRNRQMVLQIMGLEGTISSSLKRLFPTGEATRHG